MNWRDLASCLGHDPELFFPVSEIGPSGDQLAEAQQVCASCPVQEPCLAWAIKHGIDHGVWGGASEFQRRHRRRSPLVTDPTGPAAGGAP